MHWIKLFIRKRFSLLQIFLQIIGIVCIRVFFEKLLLEYPVRMDPFQNDMRLYLENIYFFIILFIVLVFFVSKLAQETFKEVANIGVKFFPIIIIPPVLDAFLYNRVSGYSYGSVDNFWSNVFTFSFVSGESGTGISVLILISAIFVAAYVFYVRKSFVLSAIACFATSFIIILLSTPALFVNNPDFIYIEFIPKYYIFPLIVFGYVALRLKSKQKFKAVMGNLRLFRAFIFIAAVILGIVAAVSVFFPLCFFEIFLSFLAVFFAWEFSVIINDIYDLKIDKISNKNRPIAKQVLSVGEYRFIALSAGFFSLSFAAIVSRYSFFTILFWLFLGYVYSVPPIRLRKNLFGNLVIGAALVLSFFAGIFALSASELLFEPRTQIFCLILFFLGSIISMSKDFKDIEGDAEENIKNLFSIYGKKKGKLAMSIFMLAALCMPLIIIKNLIVFSVVALLAVIAGCAYYLSGSEKISYFISLVAGVVFFYYLYFV